MTQIGLAQVSFKAEADRVVQTNTTFRVTYTINQNVEKFLPPSLANFRVLSGPNRSSMQSYEYINGVSKQSITTTLTYYLSAKKEGNFTIPSARAIINGKTYKSNALSIKVTKNKANPNQNNGSGNSSGKPNANDLFLRVSVSKNNVYEGQPITITVKLYTRIDLLRIEDLNFPKYPGFFIKTIYTADQIKLERENYNGKIYNTAVLRRDLIFPQKSGKLKIAKANIDLIARQVTGKTRDFFGRIVNRYENIQRNIYSNPVTITVNSLPDNAPANFSGIVSSNLSINSKIDNTKLKTDESCNLKIKVSGTGNIHLLENINPVIPAEIETFPEQKERIQFNQTGATGYKEYSFLMIPRSPGQYTIPPVEITYFDTNAKSYKTISTNQITLDVAKGKNYDAENNQRRKPQTAEQITNDIRYIKQNNSKFSQSNSETLAGSMMYYLYLIICMAIFAFIIIWKKEKLRQRSNVSEYKNRRAAKISRKQLKTAKKLLENQQTSNFYKEIITALWQYTANKFKLETAQLTKNNIKTELDKKGVPQQTTQDLIDVLNQAEYAQYGGADQNTNPDMIYQKASQVIQNLENTKSSKSIGSKAVMILMLMLSSLAINAQNEAEIDSIFQYANTLYSQNKFQEAQKLYTQIINAKYSSPELYYNLGNAYYRLQKFTDAIYCYEKAKLLTPSDNDINHNLEFAKLSITKRIPETPKLLITEYYLSTINSYSSSRWAVISIIIFGMALAVSLVYLFSQRRKIKIIAFLLGVFLFVSTLTTFIFSLSRKSIETQKDHAIIFSENIPMRSSPEANATILIRISAGHKVKIREYSGDWAEVKLGDGQVGWIPKTSFKIL